MREFFQSVKFKIIAGILVLLLGFMVYASSTDGFDTIPANIIGFFVTPFQKISSAVVEASGNFFGKFINANEISKENEKLKQEITDITNKLIDYDELKNENARYKEFLGLKENNPDMEFEEAQVVERYPDSKFYSFKIDKGSLHGIEARDTVITPEGIVGVVENVGYTYSQVKTILDPSIGIGCTNSRTGDTGTLSGSIALSKDGFSKLSYINKTSGISVGDTIFTSGSERYPKKLVVGSVKEVKPDGNGSSLYAVINPAVDIRNVTDVFVIKSFFGQSEEIKKD